jgi:ribosomal protein S18 acetylase RimI-like enzyme
MDHRLATLDDVPLLAEMNRQLTEDEQHRNRFRDQEWFAQRMRSFLSGEYQAVLFEWQGRPAAYALYRPDGEESIYLRQIFVARDCRRRGIARQAIAILREHYWPKEKRIAVDVLAGNAAAIALYKAVGFRDYAVQMEMSASGNDSADVRTVGDAVRKAMAQQDGPDENGEASERPSDLIERDPDRPLHTDVLCCRCSYNLRMMPRSGRCPECGTYVQETLHSQIYGDEPPSKGWEVVGLVCQWFTIAILIGSVLAGLCALVWKFVSFWR